MCMAIGLVLGTWKEHVQYIIKSQSLCWSQIMWLGGSSAESLGFKAEIFKAEIESSNSV